MNIKDLVEKTIAESVTSCRYPDLPEVVKEYVEGLFAATNKALDIKVVFGVIENELKFRGTIDDGKAIWSHICNGGCSKCGYKK